VIEDVAEEVKHDIDRPTEISRIFGDKNKKISTDQFTINDITAKGFQTDIDLGNINLSYGKSNTATVKVKYTVSGRKKAVLSEILQAVGIDYSMKPDTLQISVINKNTKKNIWDWVQDKYHNYNLCVELDITLPESVNKFDIDNSLGEINLDSVKGAFNIDNSLGDIDLNNVEFIGKSKIEADLGNIECSLSKDFKESSEVTMEDSLGNIHINTNSQSYTEDKEDSDEDWEGSASSTILVNKLCEMDLNVELGEITVR
jgi:hypothetical protein